MATSSNVSILEFDESSVVKINVSSSTVLAPGDLIALSGSNAVAVSSSANTTFIGVALNGSSLGEVAPIAVATKCRIKIKVNSSSSAAIVGNLFKYAAGANGTDWEVTKSTGGAGGIMWALESISAGSAGEFLVDTHNLKSGFLFEKAV